MKKLIVLATLWLATSAAHAGDSFSFDVGGRTVHIDAPKGCDSPSCVSISIPGVYNSGPRHGKRKSTDDDDGSQATTSTPPASSTVTTSTPSTPPVTTTTATGTPSSSTAAAIAPSNNPSLDPANGAQVQTSSASNMPANDQASAPMASSTSSGGLAAPAVASAPQNQAVSTPAPAANSPLGVWLTEEKEGKVRIENCGNNLCGYSIDAKSNQNGEKVLINMKAAGDKWTGRIHDPKSGSNYDSTIALKGPDKLRVQGCAFGGMFCGGQTWSRVN